MTALYFESEEGTQHDIAIFDGYSVGDRVLEDVRFIVKIENGKLNPSIHPDDAHYFSTLNEEYWLDRVTEYVQDYDLFYDVETEEKQLYLVTDHTPEPVVAVMVKAYTWEEVLQNCKNNQKDI